MLRGMSRALMRVLREMKRGNGRWTERERDTTGLILEYDKSGGLVVSRAARSDSE
jgi:hypothetical protein